MMKNKCIGDRKSVRQEFKSVTNKGTKAKSDLHAAYVDNGRIMIGLKLKVGHLLKTSFRFRFSYKSMYVQYLIKRSSQKHLGKKR